MYKRALDCHHQELNSSVVDVTHDQFEAMTLVGHISVMKNGVLQQYGSAQEPLNHLMNPAVAGFIGSLRWPFCQRHLGQAVTQDWRSVDRGPA